jgi:hypothetical protein
MSEVPPELGPYLNADVVLDTRGELIYIGRLVTIYDNFYELADADVHDIVAGRTSKELYVMDARKHGIKKNRAKVLVRKIEVVSISRLSDVLEY